MKTADEMVILTPMYKGEVYKYHECSNCKKKIYFEEDMFQPFHFEENIKYCPFCGKEIIRYAEPKFIEEIKWDWLDKYKAVVEKMYRELEYKIYCKLDKEEIDELEKKAERGIEYFGRDKWSFPYCNGTICDIIYGITRTKVHYTEKLKLEKEFGGVISEENSIEEDIELLERIDIKYFLSGSIGQSNYIVSKADEANKAIEHILSDYKRVLKENEKYKRLAEMNLKNAEEFKENMCEHRCLLKSENEELKQENEQLRTELNSLREDNKRYQEIESQLEEEERKPIKNLKKYIEEDFAYREPLKNYSDFDRFCYNHCKDIDMVLKLVERLQVENGDLRKFIIEGIIVEPDNFLRENFIPVQKVKDKIEELNSRIEKYREYVERGIETDVEWVENVADRETVKVLQELLEK